MENKVVYMLGGERLLTNIGIDEGYVETDIHYLTQTEEHFYLYNGLKECSPYKLGLQLLIEAGIDPDRAVTADIKANLSLQGKSNVKRRDNDIEVLFGSDDYTGLSSHKQVLDIVKYCALGFIRVYGAIRTEKHEEIRREAEDTFKDLTQELIDEYEITEDLRSLPRYLVGRDYREFADARLASIGLSKALFYTRGATLLYGYKSPQIDSDYKVELTEKYDIVRIEKQGYPLIKQTGTNFDIAGLSHIEIRDKYTRESEEIAKTKGMAEYHKALLDLLTELYNNEIYVNCINPQFILLYVPKGSSKLDKILANSGFSDILEKV